MATKTVSAGSELRFKRGTIIRGTATLFEIDIDYEDDDTFDFTDSSATCELRPLIPAANDIDLSAHLALDWSVLGKLKITLDPLLVVSQDFWTKAVNITRFDLAIFIAPVDPVFGVRPLQEVILAYNVSDPIAPVPT